MKAFQWILIAGGWLLALALCFRVASLESRLNDATARTGSEREESRPSPRRATEERAMAPDDDPRRERQARRELATIRGELAQARAELAEQARTREATTSKFRDWLVDPRVDGSTHVIDVTTGFIPAVNLPVDHWTGGDKRRWGHEQAAGEPDTAQAGDIPSAWASKLPDGGKEWLQVDYDRAVDLQQINVVESHNPGAIRKVTAVLPDGRETTVWEGTMEPSNTDELVSSQFPVAGDIRAQSVKVYLDTARVPGWNEIDAVQLVGRDGSKQWATGSRASSSYADP
jgi:hypothetical protein